MRSLAEYERLLESVKEEIALTCNLEYQVELEKAGLFALRQINRIERNALILLLIVCTVMLYASYVGGWGLVVMVFVESED